MALGLSELRSVIAVARLGSLGRAAGALNITQPALSRRIAEAEAALGVKLFDRLPRGVRPTDACMAFLRHAEIALASIEDAREAARNVKASRAEEITLGFIDVLCDAQMMEPCRAVMHEIARSTVIFRSASTSAQVSEDVLSGRVKLGVRYRRDDNPQLESQWLRDDAIVVACAASHPLAARGTATIDQLEREQWLGYPIPIGKPSESFNETLALRGFGGWKTMAQDSFHAQVKLLEGGFGIALLRRECIAEQLAAGRLVEIECPIPVEVPVYLTWRRGAYLGDLGERLRRALTERR